MVSRIHVTLHHVLTAASWHRLWKVKDGNRLGFDLLQHIFSNFIWKAPTTQLTVAWHRRWKSDGGTQDVAKGATRMWTSDDLFFDFKTLKTTRNRKETVCSWLTYDCNKIGLASSMTKKMQIIFHVQVSKCAFWHMTKITRCGSFKTNDRNHSKAERDNKAARPESLAVAFLARNRQSSCQQTSTVYLFQSMQHMYLFISMFSFLNIKKDMWVPFVPINPIDYVRSCILLQCVFPVALCSVFPHTSLHPNWARSSSKVTLQRFPDQIHSRSTDRVKSRLTEFTRRGWSVSTHFCRVQRFLSKIGL